MGGVSDSCKKIRKREGKGWRWSEWTEGQKGGRDGGEEGWGWREQERCCVSIALTSVTTSPRTVEEMERKGYMNERSERGRERRGWREWGKSG